MNDAPRTAKPTRAPSCYAVRARARRAEDLDVKETAACAVAGRCACGLPLPFDCTYHRTGGDRARVCSFDGRCPARCAHCAAAHKKAVRGAFGGL